MGLKTPKHEEHVLTGAKVVDFGGWDMPLHYGSQIEEHHAVRSSAGMFDVSHMLVIDLQGPGCRNFLRILLANDVDKLQQPGKALYSCMLNAEGGVIDDLIVYFLGAEDYRLVVNAGTAEKDLAWIQQQAQAFSVKVTPRRDLAMIAVQGPKARELAATLFAENERDAALAIPPFSGQAVGDWFVARTGYTGEDGWEIMVPARDAVSTWRSLIGAGVKPCGLGARDTLRLEAGMNLYGSDMDETTSPLESGLAWTIAFEPVDREFIGRAALEKHREAGLRWKFVGLVLEDRGVLRNHQRVVVEGQPDGEITSGGFSPTLGRSIALARVPTATADRAAVEVRGKLLQVRLVRPPFVRNGKACVALDQN